MSNARRLSWIEVVIVSSCILLTASVFYFSWLPRPQLGSQVSLPGFFAAWVDAAANENLRTAVPFFLLGLAAGTGLWLRRAGFRLWLLQGLLMVLIAGAAELGQLFIPARTCDPGDIGWAAAGAAAGLTCIAAAGHLYRLAAKSPRPGSGLVTNPVNPR